jgi:glycosyltransferase involved in cell wall biosynthesis
MWHRTRKRLDHVLRVRGLGILLQCGAKLAAQGMRLTVAAPLLADHSLQHHLRELAENTWPTGNLKLCGESQVPDIYLEHDLFAFPYMREETQFIPTSVVEAMRAGTPVVLPDLDFLRPLATHQRAFTFRTGDADALARSVVGALADSSRYHAVRQQAMDYVTSEMSIERSCSDIEALYASL